MKIRILSDLHIDQNPKFELKNKNVFTIIAGDISKDYKLTTKWIQENIKEGLFIEGNHAFTDKGPSLQEVYKNLQKNFPLNKDVSFLQNTYKEIDDKIFVGATLWTDFKLGYYYTFNKKDLSYRPLNSYIRGNIIKDDKLKKMTMEDTIKEFHRSIAYIGYICRKFPDKEIIVITHHCPSMLCSAERFRNNILNPALISYLEPFIQEHSNIKAWICGHCHREPLNINLGHCQLLMNPRGYTKYNECPKFNEDFVVEL